MHPCPDAKVGAMKILVAVGLASILLVGCGGTPASDDGKAGYQSAPEEIRYFEHTTPKGELVKCITIYAGWNSGLMDCSWPDSKPTP
jgi:hypothetical protein